MAREKPEGKSRATRPRMGRSRCVNAKDTDAEENSKTQKKVSNLKTRTKPSKLMTDEEPSTNRQTRKKTSKAQPKAPPLAPETEAAFKAFISYACDTPEVVFNEFDKIEHPPLGAHTRCCAFPDKNRDSSVKCLDNNLVTLKNDDGTPNTDAFLHMNKVSLEKTEREYLIGQIPMKSSIEDFWKIAFQETVAAIVILAPFYDEGKHVFDPFWPMESAKYEYYGKMFINNKKVDFDGKTTIYTLEMLPEGCSNSTITRLLHCSHWPDGGCSRSPRMILRICQWMKSCEAGPVIILSTRGIGRASTFVAIDAVVGRITKGHDTKVANVVLDLRKQRAGSIHCALQYVFIYQTVLNYIRTKAPVHTAAVEKFTEELAALQGAQSNHDLNGKCDNKCDKK